jgi:septum site-determining protein MinC
VTIATRHPRHSFRFRGRNFLALVLRPALPVSQWLSELDDWLVRSPGFFNGKPLILDLAGVACEQADIVALIGELGGRSIRIMGIEGVDAAKLDASLPPLLTGGRTLGAVEVAEAISPAPAGPDAPANANADAKPDAESDTKSDTKPDAAPEPARPASAITPLPSQPGRVPSLLVETPVRSGQAVINPDGDVIVLGSVASGAEVIAAGSIHVYGTLRGRALAGAYGNESARVFCRRYEAELIAIGEYFKAIEDIESELRQKPVQAWLSGNELKIATLDQPEKETRTWRKSS